MRVFSFVLLALISSAYAQCNGACMNTQTDTCSSGFKAGLCPGPSNIECCPMMTNSCPGACQDKSLACVGTYTSGLCPGSASVLCCEGTPAFADRYWDCANVNCSSTVPAGSGQPNYECAEFVSRSLAAQKHIPNIGAFAAQSSYGNYNYGGHTYDLLWVSSKEGGPLGLGDLLLALKWTSAGTGAAVHAASAVFCNGANGAYGHVAVGVGSNLIDAHNNARFHEPPSYYTVDAIYQPPAFTQNYTLEEAGPLPEEKWINRNYDKRPWNGWSGPTGQ